MSILRLSCTLVFSIALAAPVLAAEPAVVAPTNKLSPEQEKATFKLPPGFEIQLVAAEPEISKPMNIAFDERGRLWVTDTIEYPWPAEPGKGRDSVKVLSDFDENGRARKISTFATGLNIPLGVLPVGDGAVIYSIPEIRRYRDTDGDGKADKIEPMLATFATTDTHGMTNNFVRGFDGWIYANHGFKNESTVKAQDGSTIVMQSGNTYRFRPDGSHVELFARGQVNPFGLCFDPLGDLFSADCHTRPQYLLLRGAVYPSFGKPDDGLGFGPEMIKHLHGSTGIAGTMFYAAEQFPAEFRDNLFDGNPVTGAVNRDRLEWKGSSPTAVEMPDFLTSSDPWFRPVQVKLGPDGAMYVADFYNKIIGHYEVDLKHPGRDRTSGRIWRIVYKGVPGAPAPAAPSRPDLPDMAAADTGRLIGFMGDPNLSRALLALNELVDRKDPAAIGLLERAIAEPTGLPQAVNAMWALERLGALKPEALQKQAASQAFAVRVHVMRLLSERKELADAEKQIVLKGLSDSDPSVQRAAADAAARNPGEAFVRPLLAAKSAAKSADTHLVHALRIALRDQLSKPGVLAAVLKQELTPADRLALLDSALGAATTEAGAYAAKAAAEMDLPGDLATRSLKHAVKLAADDQAISHIAEAAAKRFAGDVDLQLDLLKSVRDGLASRGGTPPAAVKEWAAAVAEKVLSAAPAAADDAAKAWTTLPREGAAPAAGDPWVPQSRKCSDGKMADFFCSLPRGETLVGVIRSRPFAAPAKLTLWIAGHNGLPTSKDPVKNLVRLRLVEGDAVVVQAPAARNDVARKTTWDLSKVAGKQVYLEAVDGDDRKAYAWIAFGRFDPAVVPIPSSGDDHRKRIEAAIELAGAMKLTNLTDAVKHRLVDGSTDAAIRAAAAKASALLNPVGSVDPLLAVLTDPKSPAPLRDACAAVLGTVHDVSAYPAMLTALTIAPQNVQRSLAIAMSGSKDGGEALLSAVGAGKASPRLLTDRLVRARLESAKIDNLEKRLADLTKGVPDADAALQKLIDDRRATFVKNQSQFSAARGAAVFTKNCAACHRIGNEGATIGPQLDGVAKRGVDRIVEDILDSNRNVDGAFRYSILTLDDGDVITGLQRRVEGQTIVFADATGKEFPIASAKIKRRVESQLSLMPSNFGDIIPEQEFGDLLAFLLSK
jgi:putative heme-binding domain-containing protein